MRVLLLTAFAALASQFLYAQQHDIKIAEGMLWVHDTVYCQYETNFNPEPYIVDPLHKHVGKTQYNEDLKDVIFSLPKTGEEQITVRVKQIAPQQLKTLNNNTDSNGRTRFKLVQQAFLKEIYNIRFIPLDTELNITIEPYMMDDFAADIVKFNVFANGKWNDDAAWQLFYKWNANKNCIPRDVIAISPVADYNQRIKPDPTPSAILPLVSIRDQKIFNGDSVIGRYEPVQRTPAHMEYYIYNATGHLTARVYAPTFRAQAYIYIYALDDQVQILCADKTPEKIVGVAVKYLMLQKLY